MLFLYTRYEYVLGSKQIISSLKNQTHKENFNLRIITPAVKFLGIPIGGGLVKLSRLVNSDGKVIHARNYSPEIKEEVKALKKTLKIPYFKLWKGYLFVLFLAIIGFVIYGTKLYLEGREYRSERQNLTTAVQQLKTGQLYGASFFTDTKGNNMNELPYGWVKIKKIAGDTVFVQRSKKLVNNAIFNMENLKPIKPTSEADWDEHVEKMNYTLLKQAANGEDITGVDLRYIGAGHNIYPGVIMSLKGVE
ncbi:hypothetical protein SAMN05216436_1448 [bacterium A37T11]|nr:hypothetical protein SAMN05216436_1448 [bacterium A37T11]